MLIRFIIENFLSFKEETEFNMLTGDFRRFPNHVYKHPKVDILKSAILYGANGAGKSNLIESIETLVNLITEGDLGYFNFIPTFKLADCENKPVKFEIEFITEGKGYGYGIVLEKGIIKEEWLNNLNFGLKEDTLIFKRTASKKGTSKIVLAPKYVKTEKDRLLLQLYGEEILTNDALFLSLSSNKRYREITRAYRYLASGIFIISSETTYDSLVKIFMERPDFKVFSNKHFCKFDTGVKEIDIETHSFDTYFGEDNINEREAILKNIQSGGSQSVGDTRSAIALIENGKAVVKKLVAYHHNSLSGKNVKFELFDESEGTLRLLEFLPILYMLENYPITILIDEMDKSIHPALLKEFITKLQENPKKIGQLIFTTHDSNLLDLQIFRPDEIWFAEKDTGGATQFYPLSDYDIRMDLDIRKGYLSGRFGAIPFLANLKQIDWTKEDNIHE